MKTPQTLSLINGELCCASSGATFAVTNPATNELLAHVPLLDAEQIDGAITAANNAFIPWKSRPARERATFLRTLGDLLIHNSESCARILTLEQGKPLKEALGEVSYAANYLYWFAEEAVRVYGDIIPSDSPTKRILVLKQPIGVVAAITPWNFPIAMLTRKMAAALAAGCTFIGKPAPETPLSALFLAELCQQAKLPAGVVNIITGDAELIGKQLMRSSLVRKVSFTGSTEVGKILIRESANTVKKLTLELGGNAPLIVFEDADLDKALTGAISGKYRNAGQTCICINRFLVHEKISEKFTERLVSRSRELILGNGLDEKTDLGPLISDQACAKVSALVSSALREGSILALGPAPGPAPDAGSRFISPVVLTNVRPSMQIWQEEIFGPVCTVTTFKSEAEAISLANDTTYGLAAYLYSSNLSRALALAEQLDFGMVGINDTAISAVQAPFGGVKQSGFGREGSRYGIDDYLVLKYLSVGE